MSTFGNNLIERLATRLIDVQPQNQLREGSIAFAKNLNSNPTRKRVSDGRIVLYVFFAGCSFKLPTTEILSMASEHLKTLG
jgi:hypothetical protein